MDTIIHNILTNKSIQNLTAAHNTSIHVAFIVLRGKVLALATNDIGSRSRGCGYSDLTIHAEKAVVKKLGDTSKLRGATLYVIRISRAKTSVGEDRIKNSEPCYDCHLFLRKCHEKYGLASVQYQTVSQFEKMDFTAKSAPVKRQPFTCYKKH